MTRLVSIWETLEKSYCHDNKCSVQRLVNPALLYRTYAGVEGFPARRFVNLELPVKYQNTIESIHIPKGFDIKICKTGQEKEGFISCILEASTNDVNDVFTIVLEDIVEALITENTEEDYLEVLTKRIGKWIDFFKNSINKILTKSEVIGLLGELQFILEMNKKGIVDVDLMWNGPRMAEQDYQTNCVAVEIKTTAANSIKKVKISSLEQLDRLNRKRLFLCCYRIMADDLNGLTLPMMIDEVRKTIPKSRKSLFEAKLFCLGYTDNNAVKYYDKYSFCETKVYDVTSEFPKITRQTINKGIESAVYCINLNECEDFIVDSDELSKCLME